MKVFGLLATMVLVSSTGYADVLSLAKKRLLKPQEKSSLTNDCVNFSGSWQGQCMFVVDGQQSVEEAKINLSQVGCASLEINGDFYLLGSLYTKDDTYLANGKHGLTVSHPHNRESYRVDWNADMSEIVIGGALTSFPETYEGDLLLSPVVSGFKFNADGSLRQYLQIGESFSVSCDYSRK